MTVRDTFPLTHEYLAMMLGSQRAGVSITLGLLRKAGLIEHKRGNMTVINRPGLEDEACECYGAMWNELDEFFGPQKRPLMFRAEQSREDSRIER
jgi:hypothetical protein